jgi:hypothetical protein
MFVVDIRQGRVEMLIKANGRKNVAGVQSEPWST